MKIFQQIEAHIAQMPPWFQILGKLFKAFLVGTGVGVVLFFLGLITEPLAFGVGWVIGTVIVWYLESRRTP